jgi:hypothetical protein
MLPPREVPIVANVHLELRKARIDRQESTRHSKNQIDV